MLVSDFDYELPERLIAQDPLADRSASRLMVLDRQSGKVSHHVFSEIGDFLNPGDCLVINNTKVIPARLYGKRETGGQVEVLLLKRIEDMESTWECLVRPGKKCKPGAKLIFGDGRLTAEVVEVVEDGNRRIRFFYDGVFEEVLDALGEMPLPPYITHKLKDRDRYQTVYAKYDGSAAAPTAGLHFTKELLASLKEKGIRIAEITLHVGLGTFRPVKVEDTDEHHMHSEYCEVSEEAAQTINEAKAAGGRIICVGTTSVRTIESAIKAQMGKTPAADATVSKEGGRVTLLPYHGWTDIFIYPGYEFGIVDGLITNFHLPKSTLLMLASAFAGREHVLVAYTEAVKEEYRFFSFGDAMLLI